MTLRALRAYGGSGISRCTARRIPRLVHRVKEATGRPPSCLGAAVRACGCMKGTVKNLASVTAGAAALPRQPDRCPTRRCRVCRGDPRSDPAAVGVHVHLDPVVDTRESRGNGERALARGPAFKATHPIAIEPTSGSGALHSYPNARRDDSPHPCQVVVVAADVVETPTR